MKKNFCFSVLAVLLAVTTPAWAAIILPGSETSLQTIFNNITVDGSSSVNVVTDQVGYDARWSVTGTGNASATMIIEVAGNANTNTFGIYSGNNFASLFTGPASAGSRSTLSVYEDGTITVWRQYNNTFEVMNNFLTSNSFGFYLQTVGNTWFSEDSRNADGDDHMVAFQGVNDLVKLPGAMAGAWTPDEYILAWEDLAISGSDRDYNDMVLMVESVKPVPEPGTMLLLGSGLVGLASLGRKKFRR